MSDITPATSAPSTAPAPTPQAPSSVPTSPVPVRSTTAELSEKLFSNSSPEPDAQSQHQVSNDYSWLDNYKEGVHGVPVQDLLQAISEGRLPDELHDKLRLNLKDGDHEW